ncbi:EAL domain-containing protein [Marinobacter fonticola]|uniref:EAL domain-containing protein n=1 Tax=Marinobacter fonticola TaxID=2603215 RepID=UPI001D0DA784|nr:EAL domain-containing protein [Marinobacter fonticola]
MHSIMVLLLVLTALFFVGMLLLSHLNLSYSQQAMYELRRQQIKDVFFSSLTRIDARQIELQRHISTLAIIGETFYRLSQEAGGEPVERDREVLRAQLEATLGEHLRDFDGVSGAGIWYEPGVLATAQETYSPYMVRADNTLIARPVDEATRSTGYQAEPWFGLTLGADWTADAGQPERIYWSPVYFDLTTRRAMLTLARPMFSDGGRLLGVVTTDWSSDQIVDLVSHVEVTESSFAFLNDSNNRNLSSLSGNADPLLEQKIIDAILAEELSVGGEHTPSTIAGSVTQEQRLQTRSVDVQGRTYELYYAATPAGMVYGAGVPRDEIDQVLIPMRDTNYRILIGIGSVLLVLSLYLLYRIIQLMRELQASYTDVLTGLPNRTRLLKDAGERQSACLFILNLDRFKEINSLFGNECGDHILLTLASRIKRYIKTHAGSQLQLYRLASDEFAILGPDMPEPRARELAAGLTEWLRKEQVSWREQSLSLDASAGIAFQTADEREATPDRLLSQATIAVHQARQQMRHYLFYDQMQEVEKGYEQNLYWAQRLKYALDNDQLLPHFQPIYDNRRRRIVKYECLVRMRDDEHGVIAAGQFIGVANKLRLNRRITRLMIEKSFAAFAREPYEFAINLTYADIVDRDILELILKHLQANDVGPRVIFEILESDGIENYDEVFRFIERVKPYGCQIAIDDFGTGYSNFSHLLQLNIDIIKIDGSLIRYLAQDHTAFLVTKGIVQFARSLGIKTVAEFVHSEAVQAQVEALDIDFSQGEYFSMPGPELMPQPRAVETDSK